MTDNKLGAVYTPEVLADWVASELMRRLPARKPLLVLDPACGDGALLRGVLRASRGRSIQLAGLDIDQAAIRNAKRSLPADVLLKTADSLQPERDQSAVEAAWKRIIGPQHIMGVISNPPWGATLNQTSDQLRRTGYRLAQGQFDSYDLFVELCLRITPKGSILAFIVPDSMFLPEHMPLRTLLLECTQVHLVARLGEGFFDRVYRGTAVVVCENTRPRLSQAIECFRLRKELRKEVLVNKVSLQEAKSREVHLIPQSKFYSDPEKRFSIDVSADDQSVFGQIDAQRSGWATWLISGRGVELSKTGFVVLCPVCSTARPVPRGNTAVTCQNCSTEFDPASAVRRKIIKKSKSLPSGWKRLIVGEDVDRYSCASSRIIEESVPGINYKSLASFEGSKLLIRKTGVGIKAAIDESGAFTNQVVFHYRPKTAGMPSFFLDYVLGVLCSRVMLAYHLKRSGENEWRSHPYVTQKTIAELPVPSLSEGTWQWKQAKAIADAVAARRKAESSDVPADLRVDSLVAGLYGLNRQACAWVLGVLNEAQSLQAIKTMRANKAELRAVRV